MCPAVVVTKDIRVMERLRASALLEPISRIKSVIHAGSVHLMPSKSRSVLLEASQTLQCAVVMLGIMEMVLCVLNAKFAILML